MHDSPKVNALVNPYPNWEAHSSTFAGGKTQFVSPVRVKVDNCDRLWILDSGIEESLSKPIVRSPPRIIVFNLKDDQHIDTIEIPNKVFDSIDSKLNNFVVDSVCNGNDTFVYIADSGRANLIVYSYKANDTWLFSHHYFHFNPVMGNYNISNVNFQSSDGLFGLALGDREANDNANLYFHPMGSDNEFLVQTAILRNKTVAKDFNLMINYKDITIVGARGNNTQSGVSVYHKKKNVLFYTLLTRMAIGCWQTDKKFNVYHDNKLVVNSNLSYPSEMAIDESDHLWILANNYPKFQREMFNKDEVNVRILFDSTQELIKDSTCNSEGKEGKSNATLLGSVIHIISIALLSLFIQKLL